jgi:hypothetical protein
VVLSLLEVARKARVQINRVSRFRALKGKKNTSSYACDVGRFVQIKKLVSSMTGLVNLVMTPRTRSKQDGNKGDMIIVLSMRNYMFSFDGYF